MPKSRPPYAAEFRRQMVELVRSGRTPEALAREFEPCSRGRPDPGGYRFMSANQARFRIATMARVLGVSPSGYHAWRRRVRPSGRRLTRI